LIKEHKLRLQKCYLAISDGMTLIIMAASVVKSDSDLESQNSSQIQTKSKRAYNNYTCWKFRDTIQADFSGLGSLGERRQKLIEHFRTRTSSKRPLCVRSVTVFADLEQLVFEAPNETRTISISIMGYKAERLR
jgi:hypothetical protein